MKKYDPKTMILNGRYKALFNSFPTDLQDDIIKRMDQLMHEEDPTYCDRGNYGHYCNIWPTMAIDGALQSRGVSEEEAFKVISESMWSALQPEKMKKMAKRSFFLPLMKWVVPLGFNLMSGKGWHYTWHHQTDSRGEFHFECNQCLYHRVFSKYGVLERFGPMFCRADIINYGALPYTDFIRTQTLCQGGDQCDFAFIRHSKDESWTRSHSI